MALIGLEPNVELGPDDEMQRYKLPFKYALQPAALGATPPTIPGKRYDIPAAPDIRPSEPVGLMPDTSTQLGPRRPTPAADAYEQLRSQGPPQLHGVKKVLDIMGQVTKPGRAIEQAIPGSTGYYERQLGQAEKSAEEESLLGTREETQRRENRQAQSTETLQSAQADEARARADSLRNGPDKTPKADWVEGVNPQTNRPEYYDRAAGKWTGISPYEKPAQDKPGEQDKAISDYLAANGLPDTPANRDKARVALATRTKDANEGTWQLVEDDKGQTVEFNSKTGQVRPAPPGVRAKGTEETSTTRTMREAAPQVQKFVARINPLIDQLSGSLGPSGSRWQEFWAGKVGAANPQFTKLRTDVGLLTTLLMRMHVGARGGEYIMKHFQDLIDAGKQSPENMKSALEEINSYANDLQQEGRGRATAGQGGGRDFGAAPTGKPEGSTGTMPDGTKVVIRGGRIVAQ